MQVEKDPFLRNLRFFYVFAAGLLAFGLGGIGVGLYVLFIRGGSQGELILNNSLLLFSIGLVCSAFVHFSAFKTIKRMKGKIKGL